MCTCTDTQGAAVPPYTATATTTEGTDTRGYVNEAFWLGGGCGCLILGLETEPQGSVLVSVSSSSQFLPGNPTTSGFFPKVSPNVYGLSMYTQNRE